MARSYHQELTVMPLSLKEKKDILRTADKYFDLSNDNYKVDKTDFIELLQIMLENENIADNQRGANIWKKLKS